MRNTCRILFIAFVFCLGLPFASDATAAQRVAPAPNSTARAYDVVAKDWRELLRDNKRVAQRDPWLKLEERFITVARQDPKGNTGAKATFQAGRCREELAKRSKLAGDWQHAINHYLVLAKEFPKHSLADDSLFQAAFIMVRHLGKPDNARVTAQAVLAKYPRGDMAQNARELIASLAPKAAPASAALNTGKPVASPVPQAGEKPVIIPSPQLSSIICRGTSKRSSVLLELDGDVSFRHQFFAPSDKGASARLVIDIDSVTLGRTIKPHLTPSGMVVTRVRAALTGGKGKKGVRVIINMGKVGNYTVDVSTSPPGIVIQCSVSADLAGGKIPPPVNKRGPVVQGRFSGTGPGRPGTLMEQLGLTVKTVMIDAGHGGKDPGAMGNGIRESSVTLTLARMLDERLRKMGFTVLHTRERDAYVALDQRAGIANNKKADLFVSLHVNASKDKNTNGLETYFLDLARTSSAATVAARENAVSVKSISDLQFILTDLMLTSKLLESQDLAAVVHQNMCTRLRVAGFSVHDNGVRSAPFYVLMGARMPAVLVEIGYLSNEDDSRRIKSQKYLERLADGIAQGVTEYKNKLGRFNK